jgi:hypothetical protein
MASIPLLNEFLDKARAANQGVSDTDLTSYWARTYGPSVTPQEGPTLEQFLPKAREANPKAKDNDLTLYWAKTYGANASNTPTLGDVAKQVGAGLTADNLEAVGKGANVLGRQMGVQDIGTDVQHAGTALGEKIDQSMTPAGRAAQKNPIFNDDLSLGETPGSSLTLQAARSLPSMLAMMIPGAGGARAIDVLAGGGLEKLAKFGGAAKWMADRLPTALGYGAAEGAQAGLQNGAQTENEILKMPAAKLEASPVYQNFLAQSDPRMPPEFRAQQAREALARAAADQVAKQTFLWTGGVGAATGGGAVGLADRAVMKKAKDSILKGFFKGAGEETLQETLQSGGEQRIQNIAERDFANPSKDVNQGVISAAASGGAVGGLTGGLFGAGGHVLGGKGEKQPTAEIPDPTARLSKALDEILAAPDATSAIAAAAQSLPDIPPVTAPPPIDAAAPAADAAQRAFEAAGVPPIPQAAQFAQVEQQVEQQKQAQLDQLQRDSKLPAAEYDVAVDQARGAAEAQPTAMELAFQKAGLAPRGTNPAELDARAHEAATSPQNELPQPTPAQKEAGNYQKGHIRIHGLDVSIENPRGSVRSGVDENGNEWTAPAMPAHYGYVKGTTGADGDHVDVFVGPAPGAQRVYVVDQKNARTGAFDESKALIGFPSREAAIRAYLGSYADDARPRIQNVSETSAELFKLWTRQGDTKAPFSRSRVARAVVNGVDPAFQNAPNPAETAPKAPEVSQQLTPPQSAPAAVQSPNAPTTPQSTAEHGASNGHRGTAIPAPAPPAPGPGVRPDQVVRGQPNAGTEARGAGRNAGAPEQRGGDHNLAPPDGRGNEGLAGPQAARGSGRPAGNQPENVGSPPEPPRQIAPPGAELRQIAPTAGLKSPSNRFLNVVRELGGVQSSQARDIVGEKNAMRLGGLTARVFKKDGNPLDYLATLLHERGWLTDQEYNDVDGGVQRVRDLLKDASDGRLQSIRQQDIERDAEARAAELYAAEEQAIVDQLDSTWSKLSDDERANELDEIFGSDTREADQSPAAGAAQSTAPASESPARQEAPAEGQVSGGPERPAALGGVEVRSGASDGRRDVSDADGNAEQLQLTAESNTDVLNGERSLPAAESKAVVDREVPHFGLQPSEGTVSAQPLNEARNQTDLFASPAIADSVIASSESVQPKLIAALEDSLTSEDQQAAAEALGESEWNPAARRSFVQRYVEWLQEGARDISGALGQLFLKVYVATKNGLLGIAVAVNFNTAEYLRPLPLPPSQTIVKMAVEKPKADFKGATAGTEARVVADWMVRTNKQDGAPFIIADKKDGLLYAFDEKGTLLAKAPALFGETKSDTLTEAQANKPIERVTKADKITPAGTFASRLGESDSYGKVLVVKDYKNTRIVIHRVYLGTPSEQRMQRLQSESPEDNRISYGCINALPEFIDSVIVPHFSGKSQVVILPESMDAKSYFGINDSTVTEYNVAYTNDSAQAEQWSWGGDKYGVREQRSPDRAARRRKSTEPPTPDTAFRRTASSGIDETTSELGKREVRDWLDEAISKVSVPVEIYGDVSEAQQDMGVKIPNDAAGLMHKGRIGLIAPMIDGKFKAQSTFWHEAFHAGLHRKYGRFSEAYDKALTQVAMANADVRERAKLWREKFSDDFVKSLREVGVAEDRIPSLIRMASWEEAIADISGENNGKPIRFADQLVAALQKLLRAMGLTELANWMESKTNAAALTLIEHSLETIQRKNAAPAEQTGGMVPAFSRASAALSMDNVLASTSNFVRDMVQSESKFNAIHRTLSTQQHKALINEDYKPVYDESQRFMNDISRYANEPADLAPDMLPRPESVKQYFKAIKTSLKPADVKAISDALMEGTLYGGGSPLQGVVWTDEELRGNETFGRPLPVQFNMTDEQIKLYRQSLAATGKSLDEFSKSLIHRYARAQKITFDRDKSLAVVVHTVQERLEEMADGAKSEATVLHDRLADAEKAAAAEYNHRDASERNVHYEAVAERDRLQQRVTQLTKTVAELQATKDAIADVERKTTALKEHGYFPASRFGLYTVYVTRGSEQLFFGRYDTRREANRAARELKAEHPDAEVQKGEINPDKHKLFQGLSLDALETFAEHMDIGNDAVVQEFLRVATAERSLLKRQIHRKGVAGYSEDVPRVLSQFITSNARTTSSNYHLAEMKKLTQDIKDGGVQREATRLVDYLQNPNEESAKFRSFLFLNFIGGSLAHGIVNMTQPLMMTAPFLTQTTSYADAIKKLGRAALDYTRGAPLGQELAEAMKRAKGEGIVAPQEIHQLMAQAGPSLMGKSLKWRAVMHIWGGIYAVTEQFNRATTFIAAYRIAQQKGIEDPYAFARDAVEQTQGVYNKANRPNAARNPVGSLVMTFRQFSIQYLELMKRLYDKDKTAFAAMVLTLIAMAGLEGLPFAEDIEDMVDTLGQWMGFGTNSKKALRKWAVNLIGKDFAEFALNGVSAGLPVDVSNRLGFQNLLPGTAMLKPSEQNKARDVVELLGPAGQFIPVDGTALGRMMERLSKGDLFGASKAGAPVALRNFMSGYEMLTTGSAKDIKGNKTVDVSTSDAISKIIGLNPSKVADESRIIRDNMADIAIQKTKESEIVEKWAHGIFEKDSQKVRDAQQEMRDWNQRNPDLRVVIHPPQIQSAVKRMRETRQERFIKTVPREIRQQVKQDFVR